ncbi:ABC transporter ATP-binding protein [Alicyclobacillus tolerans]|uniref:ABC transporter ATP-binding protein n=1 Tax=Alicyclobacillus tolerans TaxID=90970 RepID=UPI001F3EE4D9|nr:ABC transporter ATP-binding protein [Alicyclobacillus tolerans]MCF8568347.1 ABC transporter ATP-binding protein [Alicyclobacillus tolerans]
MILLSEVSKTVVDGRRKISILKDITLSVQSGEFLAIVGPSGSGKSTLMNLLGLLDKPTAGQYQFDGQPVSSLPAGKLATFRNRHIGFVFQSFMLMPRMSVLRNVELPLLYQPMRGKERKRLACEALEQVGMIEKIKQKAIHLSGGERQRVAIARALVNNPRLILADEPTGNLDEELKGEILSIFLALKQQGRTIVMVTHDREAASIADRYLTIRHGELVEETPLTRAHLTPQKAEVVYPSI